MVGAEGFEPPTLCSQSRCATRLRYAPTLCFDCSAIGLGADLESLTDRVQCEAARLLLHGQPHGTLPTPHLILSLRRI